jgi:hypothetical protein
MALTPEERSRRNRRAALIRWTREQDRTAATEKAREAFGHRFEDIVDPDRRLTDKERRKRARTARALHFAEMQQRSIEARRAKRTAS